MGNDYSEAQLIKQTCIDIFKNQLQLEIANVYQRETFSKNGTIGRASEAARNLLNKPKNTEFKVDRRIEKVQTASTIKKAMNDYLYSTSSHLWRYSRENRNIIQLFQNEVCRL